MTTVLDTVDVSDVRDLSQVLSRTPNGVAIAQLAERLGLLTSGVTRSSAPRRPFVSNIAQLAPPQLSDEQSHWAGEYGRIVEILGLLQGQEKYLSLRGKAARSAARSRIRRDTEGPKSPTAGLVNDEAEEDPAVRDIEEQASIVVILLASAMAAKEATAMYLSVISREISFRCSQMDAKIYG